MGRRFPEFCILRAVCLVCAKVSSSSTGDARVASYQAAINSVAKRYYADWPFMVEVLNKWLEMNQDFVRDPICYTASNSSPIPPSTTMEDNSAIQETPHQALTLTSNNVFIHPPPTAVDTVSLPLSPGAEHIRDPSLATPASGTELNDLGDPHRPSNDKRDLHVPFLWTGTTPFFPSLWGLGVDTLSLVVTSNFFRKWFVAPKSSTQRTSNSSDTRWFSLTFLTSPYKEWWDILKKPFTLRSGRYPKFK